MMLTPKKVRATGMPMNSNKVEPPNINQAAMGQLLMCRLQTRNIKTWGTRSSGAYSVLARTALGMQQAVHAKHHLDGQQHKHHRQWRQ